VADSIRTDRNGHANDHVPGKALPVGQMVKAAPVRY
jgi:hypothetical protein